MEKLKINKNLINYGDDIEKYRQDCFNEILNDNEFYELISKDFQDEEIKSNVSKFYRYLKDLNLIKNINSYEDCEKNNKFFYYEIKKENGKLIEKQKEVPAYHDYIYYLNHYLYSDFDYKSLYKLTLKDIPRKELINNVKKVSKLKPSLFYIYGSSGTFKTLTAIAMCNGYIRNKDYKVAFINSYKRIKELSDLSFNKFKKDEYDNMLNKIFTCDVLVLDGFGEEYKNAYIRDSLIIPILKERFKNKNLITIITSPFSIKEISSLYNLNNKNLIQEKLLDDILSSASKEMIYSGKFGV